MREARNTERKVQRGRRKETVKTFAQYLGQAERRAYNGDQKAVRQWAKMASIILKIPAPAPRIITPADLVLPNANDGLENRRIAFTEVYLRTKVSPCGPLLIVSPHDVLLAGYYDLYSADYHFMLRRCCRNPSQHYVPTLALHDFVDEAGRATNRVRLEVFIGPLELLTTKFSYTGVPSPTSMQLLARDSNSTRLDSTFFVSCRLIGNTYIEFQIPRFIVHCVLRGATISQLGEVVKGKEVIGPGNPPLVFYGVFVSDPDEGYYEAIYGPLPPEVRLNYDYAGD
ncbi:hypothetical protein M011DRAFT_465636 [Sporormia fimetaria CBS 119925]|uniref:Uncharacterized protein n=1 Tax=Sporormia fimetaria CBS 119925 TaxID=1340428 RepID=A0A6A6VJJ5_9PLEO|nr:hypothetical protein M011DRAFT_465636 [Sporormia fimetaria CBS 119925]